MKATLGAECHCGFSLCGAASMFELAQLLEAHAEHCEGEPDA